MKCPCEMRENRLGNRPRFFKSQITFLNFFVFSSPEGFCPLVSDRQSVKFFFSGEIKNDLSPRHQSRHDVSVEISAPVTPDSAKLLHTLLSMDQAPRQLQAQEHLHCRRRGEHRVREVHLPGLLSGRP
jgi:hypothetical protein